MTSATHIIDPDGEVIIVLRNPNAPFAVMSARQDLQTPLHASPEENDIRGTAEQIEDPSCEIETPRPVIYKHAKKRSKKNSNNKKKSNRNRPTTCAATSSAPDRNPPSIEEAASEEPAPQEPPAAERSAWWPEESPLAEEPSSVQDSAAVEHAADFDQAADEPAPEELFDSDTDEPLDVPCFRIQVSAKHLILASSVFKRILTGGWMESTKFLKQGSVEIDTDSWDLDALMIVLHLIHCQSFQIPRKLSLEMLAKVAVIADYYECGEAVDMLARVWISALDEKIPATYLRDVILWIWVSCFYRVPGWFKQATSIAMSCSTEWISNLGLPIPRPVMEKINNRRESAIDQVISRLYKVQLELLCGALGCCYECKSIMYGALTMKLQCNPLLSPRPTHPFTHLSNQAVVECALGIKSPRWYESGGRYYDTEEHRCSSSTFISLLSPLQKTIEGLNLLDFIQD